MKNTAEIRLSPFSRSVSVVFTEDARMMPKTSDAPQATNKYVGTD